MNPTPDGESRHHAHPRLRGFARSMRHEPAPAEARLWHQLRDRKLNGVKFRRQQPVGPFIADFFCADCKLVIELDGETHEGREAYDAERTAWLAEHGLKVLRFTNADVFECFDRVLARIAEACPPSPLVGEGGGEGAGVRSGTAQLAEPFQPVPANALDRLPNGSTHTSANPRHSKS